MVTRRNRSSRRRTRKRGDTMTVEGLHASFTKIDTKIQSMIKKGISDSSLGCCLRQSWKQQFHRHLSEPAVKGMIVHYRTLYGTRKTRKHSQKGGMAPLDSTMSQGQEAIYGKFPIESRPTTLDRSYENSIGKSCDPIGQNGGGLMSTLWSGHPPNSVPQNPVAAGVSAGMGSPTTNPSHEPMDRVWGMQAYRPGVYEPTLKPLNMTQIYTPF